MMPKLLSSLVVCSLIFSMTSGYAGEVVILKSNAGKYPEGGVLSSLNQVQLAGKEKITVLYTSGNVRTLKGVGNYHLSTEDRPAERLPVLRRAPAGHKSTVLMRGNNAADDNQELAKNAEALWWVDIDGVEPQCVVAGQPVYIWRKYADDPLKRSIKRESTGESAELSWAPETHVIEWPDGLVLEDGAPYLIAEEGYPWYMKVFVIPEEVSEKKHGAFWLEAKGCLQQMYAFQQFVESTAQEK